MTRPLRIEFPGALYHVMSRGNERRRIVRDDVDVPQLQEFRPRPSLATILTAVGEHFDNGPAELRRTVDRVPEALQRRLFTIGLTPNTNMFLTIEPEYNNNRS